MVAGVETVVGWTFWERCGVNGSVVGCDVAWGEFLNCLINDWSLYGLHKLSVEGVDSVSQNRGVEGLEGWHLNVGVQVSEDFVVVDQNWSFEVLDSVCVVGGGLDVSSGVNRGLEVESVVRKVLVVDGLVNWGLDYVGVDNGGVVGFEEGGRI